MADLGKEWGVVGEVGDADFRSDVWADVPVWF